MSHSGKPLNEMGLDSLADRFRELSNLDGNKPDFREIDLGSSISQPISRRRSDGASSYSSLAHNTPPVYRSNGNAKPTSHSGELFPSTASESVRSMAPARNSRPGHRRSMSSGSPLIYSGSGSFNNSSSSSGNSGSSGGGGGGGSSASSVSSPNNTAVYPSGNICPSGKILKSNMGSRPSSRTDTLCLGTGNYGHGSIIRGGGGGGKSEIHGAGNAHYAGESTPVKRAMSSSDAEEVKNAGNELYRRGHFVEALPLYERAISISPENPAYRSNKAAALTMLGRLGEAVRECEEALRLDPTYGRAHQRLASIYLRLGQVENARHHLCFKGQNPEKAELQKLLLLEKHLSRCAEARKIGDWKSAMRECDAAMVAGVDSSPQILACKAEACLKLHQLENADSSISSVAKLEPYPASCSLMKFFGMLSEAYVVYVQALVHMAFGRFEHAVGAAEKARKIDPNNIEIMTLLSNVKSVSRARSRGKDLFDSGRYTEASVAFGEGLKYDLSNSVLYCNRAVCWSKLGLWEQSVEDCNQALKIQPSYTKALLRRAASNGKLERWSDAVRDYEVLRHQLPGDSDVAEALASAEVALKKSRQELVHSVKCGGEVENIYSFDRFKAVVSSPGISVVHFKAALNQQCERISVVMESLSTQYTSLRFFKVDIEKTAQIAKAEGIRSVPTVSIYRNGSKVREVACPSQQILESVVRQYSL